MALIATFNFIVSEKADDAPGTGYSIVLSRADGFQLHRSHGPDRATAIQGLKDYGFTVEDQA